MFAFFIVFAMSVLVMLLGCDLLFMGMVFSGLYIFLFISIWWLTSNLCSLLHCFLSLSCVNVCSSVPEGFYFLFGCPFRCDVVSSYV